jgi:hypothetical protein
MKTEAEIRRHLANLRVCQQSPCGCKGTDHEEECRKGGLMMEAVIMNLAWALGEAPELDEHVAMIEKDAELRRALRN